MNIKTIRFGIIQALKAVVAVLIALVAVTYIVLLVFLYTRVFVGIILALALITALLMWWDSFNIEKNNQN